MKRLAAHAIKGGIHYTAAELDNELLFMRTVLAKRLEKRPANAGLQVGAQYATGCAALALGRESDALELITASSEASGAMYAAISARAGTQVSFTFRGAQLSGPSGPPGYNAGPLSWVAATCVALALGRHDVVSVLAAVPVPVLEQAPGERDACWARLAYALQALLAEEDVEPPLTEFARLSQPQHLSIAAPDSVARYAALAGTMRAIADKDQAGFDKSLLERLQVHKRAHSRGKAAADVAGLIDPLASGMAVLGGARGLTSNVESDYMPQWLLGKLS